MINVHVVGDVIYPIHVRACDQTIIYKELVCVGELGDVTVQENDVISRLRDPFTSANDFKTIGDLSRYAWSFAVDQHALHVGYVGRGPGANWALVQL